MRHGTAKILKLISGANVQDQACCGWRIGHCALLAAPAGAFADKPKFNPGQKGKVCSAPGPNSNPNCVPG
jgi:hypothetical protein